MGNRSLAQFLYLLIATTAFSYQIDSQQPVDDDNEFRPQTGTYHYVVKWHGTIAGTAELNVALENDYYKVSMKAQTRKTIDRLYKLRYYGEVKMTTDDMQPVETILKQQHGERKKNTTIVFGDDGTIDVVEVKKKGKKKKVKERQIESSGFTMDPFSATFLARRLDWKTGEAEVFEIFTGKRSYLLKLNCQGKCQIEVTGEKREAWLITSTYRRADRPDEKFQDSATIVYLATDSTKDVLRIENRSNIGRVDVDFVQFVPAAAIKP